MSITVSPLSISEVLDSKSNSLFIVNNTDLGRQRPKGVLHLVVKDATNTEIAINIPKTWIPINLANYCEVESIVKNNTFRDYIRRGIIYAISEEQANEVLGTAAALTESRKVAELENSLSAAMRGSVTLANTVTIFGGDESVVANEPNKDAVTNGPNVDLEVKTLVADFNNGDDDTATSRRVLGIQGDRESWIWASEQIRDTSSMTYLAISDKISEF